MEEFMNKLLLTSIAALSLAAAPAVAQQGKSMHQPQATMQQHNGSQAQNENRANASANLNQDEIRQAQQALNQKGFNVGRPDGLMGPKTENAIKEFQQKQGLNATGQLDDQSLAALGVSASTTGQNTGQSSQQRGNPQPTAK
jgi:peptidoglycan hydrolase-like protein with peptidoglycan-binding domain